jgi:hypothetical protein
MQIMTIGSEYSDSRKLPDINDYDLTDNQMK